MLSSLLNIESLISLDTMKTNIFSRFALFIFGFILFADGLYLIVKNKSHFGVIFPFILGLTLCTYALSWHQIQTFLNQHFVVKRWIKFAWVGFWIWLLSVLIFFIYLDHSTQNIPKTNDVKAIIVLGSGVENGRPSAILAERLNTAAHFAKDHPAALIILSGGLDHREQQTEAEVMRRYLKQQFPALRNTLALEDQSTSTELNLKNSKPILEQHQILLNDSIVIVTSDFHTIRSKAIAHKQQYQQAYMLSSPTPVMTRYNAWLREYFAFISGWILREY